MRREIRLEWLFGHHSRNCGISMSFGDSDNGDGVQIAIRIPLVFSVYLSMAGFWRLNKPVDIGIAIHNQSIWFHTLSCMHESNSSDPWWRKTKCIHFPWQYDWYSTEILEHKAFIPYLQEVAWREDLKFRRKSDNPFAGMALSDQYKKAHSQTYDYTYTLKSGEVQHRKATVYVDRMTWRMRWWPLLPFSKSRTSINISFNEEVGEGTGSWKGGCTGCGYDMKTGETPLETLRRMEKERKFDR